MGRLVGLLVIMSAAVLITVYGVLILFSPERFRRLIFFLSPGTKKHPWVLDNLEGVEYRIVGVLFVLAGIAMLYLLVSQGLVTARP